VALHLQLDSPPLQSGIQLIQVRLSLGYVSLKPWYVFTRDSAIDQLGENQLLTIDQFAERNLDVFANNSVLSRALVSEFL
jgi:hypothetical protein